MTYRREGRTDCRNGVVWLVAVLLPTEYGYGVWFSSVARILLFCSRGRKPECRCFLCLREAKEKEAGWREHNIGQKLTIYRLYSNVCIALALWIELSTHSIMNPSPSLPMGKVTPRDSGALPVPPPQLGVAWSRSFKSATLPGAWCRLAQSWSESVPDED